MTHDIKIVALCAALVATPLAAQTPVPPLPEGWVETLPVPPGMANPQMRDFLRWMEEAQRLYGGQRPGVPPLMRLPEAHSDFVFSFTPPVSAPVDLDQDGVVSEEEAAAHAEAIFVALDRDGDRSLAPGEVTRRAVIAFPVAPREEAEPDARFLALDGDADGAVSKAEFMDVAHAHYEEARDPTTGEVTPWSYRRRDWY